MAGEPIDSLFVEIRASLDQFDAATAKSSEKARAFATAAAGEFGKVEARLGQLGKSATDDLARLDAAQVRTAKSTADLSRAHAGLSTQAMAAGHAMRSFTDQIMAGASPTQALATQIGHLQYAATGPGGLSGAFGEATRTLTGMLTVGRVVGAGLIGIAVGAAAAWSRYDDMQKQALATLQGLGRGVGVTVTQFDALTQRAAAQGNMSVSQASDITNALARTGQLSADNLEKISSLGKAVAATFGTDLDGARQKLVALFSDPQKGIAQLQAQFRFLDAATQQEIEHLFRVGKAQDAIAIAIDKWKGSLANAEQTTGAFSRLWDGIKTLVSDTDLALGRVLDKLNRGPGGEELKNRIAAIKAEVENPTAPGAAPRGYQASGLPPTVASTTPPPPPRPEEFKAAKDAADAFEESVLKAQKAQQELAKSSAMDVELTRQTDRLRDMTRELSPMSEDYRKAKDALEVFEKALGSSDPALKERVLQIKDIGEASSVAKQMVDSQTDAEGRFINAAERARLAGEARAQTTRAQTVAEKEAAAVREVTEAQRGRAITLEEAAIERENAARQVREEAAKQFREMNRTQQDQLAVLDLEKGMIFANSEERERALAVLKAEQELRRQGLPLLSEEGQRYLENAGKIALQTSASKDLQAAVNFAGDSTKEFFKGFAGGLREGKSAMESFTSALNNLATRLQDKAIDLAVDAALGKNSGAGGFAALLGLLRGGTSAGALAGANASAATASSAVSDSLAAAAMLHSGGIVGIHGELRYVHPSYFDNAPRHHIGTLAHDERAAVLQTGELVLDRSTVAALRAPQLPSAPRFAAAQAPPTEMHFHNAPPVVSKEETVTASGGRRIDTVFAESFAGSMQHPQVQQAMAGYGVKPRLKRRGM